MHPVVDVVGAYISLSRILQAETTIAQTLLPLCLPRLRGCLFPEELIDDAGNRMVGFRVECTLCQEVKPAG